MRRKEEHISRKVSRADIGWRRKRIRPKTRWKDDLRNTGLRAGEETNRAMWRTKMSRRPYMMGKARGRERCDRE